MLMMSELGCAKPLYAVFGNGLCYGFVHGQCLDADSVRLPVVNRLVAAEMVKIHAVVPSGKKTLDVWPGEREEGRREERRRERKSKEVLFFLALRQDLISRHSFMISRVIILSSVR